MRPTKKLISTAYHEAGHAVAWHLQGHKSKMVTIVPDDDLLGSHSNHHQAWRNFQPDADGSAAMLRRIDKRVICLWAGPLAEKKYRGRMNRIGASGDFDFIIDFALYARGDSDSASNYITEMQNRTQALLDDPNNWAAVEALAAALLEHGTLKGKEVTATISEAITAEVARPKG